MNDIKIYDNPEFGSVRMLEEDGEPLFCGADVARALGYVNAPDALTRHCKGIVKRDSPISGKTQEINFIPEGDVYRLIVHSKLPGAERFEKWVFEEVLPAVRRHGAYMTPETLEAAILNPDVLIRIATELKEEQTKRRELEAQAERDRPKVLFADAVSASDKSILIGELAKLLKQNGVDIGQNRLFEWMRQAGYLIRRKGTDYNMPTQRSMELRLFEIKETAITHSDGFIGVSKTAKVTGRGQEYFVRRFLEGGWAQ